MQHLTHPTDASSSPPSTSSPRPRIQKPCPAAWASMRADDTTRRFCAVCEKHVHNLDAMTPAQVSTLLDTARANGERLCVRYQADAFGRLTSPTRLRAASSPLPQQHGVRRLLAAASLIAATLAVPAPSAADPGAIAPAPNAADADTADADASFEAQLWDQERAAARKLSPLGLELEDEAFAESPRAFSPYTPPAPYEEPMVLGEMPY
jgi:hypothetical protein